jgi:hypothetical protein
LLWRKAIGADTMNELENSAALIKNDLKVHDFKGAWAEFSREVLSLERRRGIQSDTPKKEGEYFANVIKQSEELKALGFPYATLHQRGDKLEMVFSDPRQGVPNLEWTSFTRGNQNKQSHDLTAQEVTPPPELKALTAKEDKSNTTLKGAVQDKEYLAPSNYATGADQNVLQSGTDKTSIRSTDRVRNVDYASSRIGMENTDQAIEWNKWVHGIQGTLQSLVLNDEPLQKWMNGQNGTLQFRFTVDNQQNISNITVQDSGRADAISFRCSMLASKLNKRRLLDFPKGSMRSSYQFEWNLPYGTDVQNAPHYQDVPAEHRQVPVLKYGDNYEHKQRNW